MANTRKRGTKTDVVGKPVRFVAGSNVTLAVVESDTETVVTVTASGGGGSLSDGDKGDITVSGSGATWNIDAGAVGTTELAGDAVTYAKIQNVSAASRLLGRGSASGAGDVEELTLGTNLSLSGTTLNAAASVTIGSASVAFTDGDTARRVTVSDAAVSSTSRILLSVTRPTTTDANDPGYCYTANVISRGTGTFDVFLACTDIGGGDCTLVPPNETVTLFYTVA
jgi:hypothetical protein